MVFRPDHPNAHQSGYVPEHRLVLAEYFGRPLDPAESVHHRNGDRLVTRIENLELRIGTHARGVAIEDAVAHAVATLRLYAPDLLRPE